MKKKKPAFSINNLRKDTIVDKSFYASVLNWVAIEFAICALVMYFIAPLIPREIAGLMSIGTFVLLLLTSLFVRYNPRMIRFLALFIPAIIGIPLYHYLRSFNTDIILLSLIGTVVIFTSMALVGWFSKVTLYKFLPTLFFITIGIIIVSLMNVFFFHLTGLQLIISIAILIIMSIFSYIDIQAVRDKAYGDEPASYALNIFLDIINIFQSLLNILGILSD